ncbi:hypothetical protein LZ32DRAFT_414952 [Colletotrichum eremochloae]|nr:hypothetical protein LZ32DRAFT_414952 [Colletotrichum eremochloae]
MSAKRIQCTVNAERASGYEEPLFSISRNADDTLPVPGETTRTSEAREFRAEPSRDAATVPPRDFAIGWRVASRERGGLGISWLGGEWRNLGTFLSFETYVLFRIGFPLLLSGVSFGLIDFIGGGMERCHFGPLLGDATKEPRSKSCSIYGLAPHRAVSCTFIHDDERSACIPRIIRRPPPPRSLSASTVACPLLRRNLHNPVIGGYLRFFDRLCRTTPFSSHIGLYALTAS